MPILNKSNSVDNIGRAQYLLGSIAQNYARDFTGIGLVFYRHLEDLPYLQLGSGNEAMDTELIRHRDLASTLCSASISTSGLHDGFHFIDVELWKLTHLAQFISPPIPRNAATRFRANGARSMAATLASIIPGIECVGLVSADYQIHLFCNGIDISIEK